MKKILFTLALLIPALFANAQGPIKQWNDKLDDFIEIFNQVTPSLNELYAANGAPDTFIFTYFEPQEENVVMETSILDNDAYNNINEDVMKEAKGIVVKHLGKAAATNARQSAILNDFEKRNTNIVLLYSTPRGGETVTKKLTITPAEIKAAK